MSPVAKIGLMFAPPLFCWVAYRFGIVGGTDVVTGQPTARRGAAFWALVAFGVLAEIAATRLLWF